MRTLFGALAVLLGLASICLTARYGYKSADTVIDGVISAVVFGSIALCAFLFDAAAVRLWFMKHRVGSGLIGFIAAAALVVTFSNSLGSIVSRTDAVLAQRQGVAESRADNRRELLRLEKTLAELGRFTPADEEAVKAAKRAADTSTSNKIAECDKRGPNVSTAKDARTEMRELIRGYRDWCAAEGLRAIDLSKALDEVEALCSQIGIQIEVAPDQRVYCVGATIRPSSA